MSRTRTITLTLGSVAAGAILATGVTGLALADDQSTPAPSASAGAPSGSAADSTAPGTHSMDGMRGGPGRDGMRDGQRGPGGGMHGMRGAGPMGEALHGELVVKADDGTISTVRQVRGTVTAVSGTSITVEAEDGYTATFAITADTDVRVGLPQRGTDPESATDTIADVSVGDVAHVHGTVTGSTATATHLMAMTAEQAAELEALRAEHAAEHQAREGAASSGSGSSGTGSSGSGSSGSNASRTTASS